MHTFLHTYFTMSLSSYDPENVTASNDDDDDDELQWSSSV